MTTKTHEKHAINNRHTNARLRAEAMHKTRQAVEHFSSLYEQEHSSYDIKLTNTVLTVQLPNHASISPDTLRLYWTQFSVNVNEAEKQSSLRKPDRP